MVSLSREQQNKLTSDHLKGNAGVEVWLIPYFVTLAIMIIIVSIMIVMHFVNRKRRQDAASHGDYRKTNCQEMLQELDDVSRNGIADNNRSDDWSVANSSGTKPRNDYSNLPTSDI